jgi:SAM-dependent methyltransferase
MDLSRLSDALQCGPAGIWETAGGAHAVSYPTTGHAECFRIEDESFWFAHRNELISLALRRFLTSGPFLDIGGGNGVVSSRLERDGIETVLLEPGPDGAGHAKQRNLANVVCATLEDAAFKPHTFQGAGLFDVIEHVDDDLGLLRAAKRVLAPDGVLAVTVPAYQWLWSAEDEIAGHFRRYTVRRLGRVLRSAGYDVKWASYFFGPLVAPLFVGRSLRHRFGKRDAREIETNAAQQHTPNRFVRAGIDTLLAPEVRAVKRGGRIPFGTSILAIARA